MSSGVPVFRCIRSETETESMKGRSVFWDSDRLQMLAGFIFMLQENRPESIYNLALKLVLCTNCSEFAARSLKT